MKHASSHVRDALAYVSQKEIALTMRVDEGAVTKIVHNQQGVKINQMDAFLEVLRLRIVPDGQVVLSEEMYAAMKVLARAFIDIVFSLPPETITPELREAATLLAAEWLAKEARNGCANEDTWALAAVLSGKALQDTIGFRVKAKT